MIGLPRGIRTPDRRLRRPMLYPAELWAENGTRRIVVMYAGVINAKQAGASSSHQIDPEKRPFRQKSGGCLTSFCTLFWKCAAIGPWINRPRFKFLATIS